MQTHHRTSPFPHHRSTSSERRPGYAKAIPGLLVIVGLISALLGVVSASALAEGRSLVASRLIPHQLVEKVTPEAAVALMRTAKERSVVVYAESTNQVSKGSGFVLRRLGDFAVVATNAHVILAEDGTLHQNFRLRAPSGNILAAYPVAFERNPPDVDFAFLVARDPAHQLGPESSVATARPGQFVVCVGNPLDQEFLVSPGHVLATHGNLFTHDCIAAHGSSGGPVFDVEGQVVGMHTYGTTDGTRVAIDLSRFLSTRSFRQFQVSAARGWQDTGLHANAGTQIAMMTSGTWSYSFWYANATAHGVSDPALAGWSFDKRFPHGSLLCRVGGGEIQSVAGRWQGTGNGPSAVARFTATTDGFVSCRPNDNDVSNNAGVIDVIAMVTNGGAAPVVEASAAQLASSDVTVYGASWCAACRRLESDLTRVSPFSRRVSATAAARGA